MNTNWQTGAEQEINKRVEKELTSIDNGQLLEYIICVTIIVINQQSSNEF